MNNKLVWVFVLLNWSIFSQDIKLSDFTPRTPEATAFLKYGEYPINFSSGTPNISIPIYTVNAGGFEMPITLDYHASGIKVKQEATMVGLGWNLNTGAQIILSSRDGIDEIDPEIDNRDFTVFTNYITNYPYDFNSPLFLEYQKSKVKDTYSFSSPTVNGNFYINHFNNNDVVVFPPDAFKVELLGTARSNLSFKITDKLGNIYMFNATKEKTYRWLTHHDEYISAWYVDQIKTPKNEYINFTYQDDGEVAEESNTEYREIKNGFSKCGCAEQTQIPTTISPNKNSFEKTYTNAKKLKQIIYNNNRSKIEFILQSGRYDLINQNSFLTSIKINNRVDVSYIDSGLIKQVFFEYSYFNPTATGTNAYKSKRLKLDRIFELGDTNTHSFLYNDNIPNKDSKGQDYFGYYNGASNSDMIPKHIVNNTIIGSANREVNTSFTQVGMLKEIQYPTKGKSKFNYENNTFYGIDELEKYSMKNEHCSAGGSGSANQPAQPWEEGLTCPFETCISYSSFNFDANNANGILNYSISNTGSTASRNIKYKYCRIKVYGNGQLIHDSGKKNVNYNFSLNIGTINNCSVQIEAYGSGMNISADLNYLNFDNSLKNVKSSGLRIQSIENYDSNDNTVSKKSYNYSEKNDLTKSSGKFINPLPFNFVKSYKTFTRGICNLSPYVDSNNVLTVFSQSQNNSESNIVTYKFIKETTVNTKNPTENIFSDYEFTTDEDWVLPAFNIQLSLGWKRGKLIEKNDYKTIGNSNIIVKKIKNSYFEDNSKVSYYRGFKLERKVSIDISSAYEASVLFSCGIPQNVQESILSYNYAYPMPWFYQISSESTDYFYNNNNQLTGTVVNNTNYFYDNPTHLQLTRTEEITSNNEIIITKKYYPDDLLNIPLMINLKNQNRIGEVIKTEVFKNTNLLLTQLSSYKDWGNNLFMPEIIQSAKNGQMLEDRVKFNVLDNTNGKLLELEMVNGTKIVYIWGYNKTEPVAKIENTTYASINQNFITAVQNASNTETEVNLLDALNNLRNSLPNTSMITTYTYIPLVGVSTITDPKGDKITYTYDTANRLQFVKDKEGNILNQNQYHYKN